MNMLNTVSKGRKKHSLRRTAKDQDKKARLPMIEKTDTKAKNDLRWYLVQCKPNAAKIAVRNLKNQCFGTFLPLQEITKRKGKTFQRQIRQLFPGYLFTGKLKRVARKKYWKK